jgi:hypothetical protein
VQPRGCIYFAQNLADARVNMYGLSSQYRQPKNVSMSRDLAQQIVERSLYGKVVVAAKNPASLLSAVRKQWMRIIRLTMIERSRTLKADRIMQLTNELHRLRSLKFAVGRVDEVSCNVLFATADDLVRLAPACSTLFVTYDFPREYLHLMTSWMPQSSLVVFYGQR